MRAKFPLDRAALLLAAFAVFPATFSTARAAEPSDVSFEKLTPGMSVSGFRAEAVYLNDADKPMGARFIHEKTGFTLDLLQIQSVPQAFTWVNSFPTSDMGEPHTQEHLLLGKGNVGRAESGREGMLLVGSSAYTQQWRTCYFFNTGAGAEAFYTVFEGSLNAFVHPDYTDEEIRREVCHWGVAENPADGRLRLEEKGTVYQEMVSSFDRPIYRVYRAMNQALYGPTHPLAVSSGGYPARIREMKPSDIRKFHGDNYHLPNMGSIVSVPPEMTLSSVLARLDESLNRVEPAPPARRFMSEADLPEPQMATAGSIQIVDYPHKNDQQPGWMMFAWPPVLSQLSIEDEMLLQLFLTTLAGDPTTNLYKKFVDSKTREIETGATGVFANPDGDQGHPVFVTLTDVTPGNMTEEKIGRARQMIVDEIARVAAFPEGSPELAEFNERASSTIIEVRRGLSKFVNSPPGFGFRGTSSAWMDQLRRLEKTGQFKRTVTLPDQLAGIEKKLSSPQNMWAPLIQSWHLTDTVPYAVAARPKPSLVEEAAAEKEARTRAQVDALKAEYKLSDDQEAIARYKAIYDATTAELEALALQTGPRRFTDNPPLSLDDQLDYRVGSLAGGVPIVTSTFENMTSATTGIALRLDGIPAGQLVYLSGLPGLLNDVGVIKDGKSVSYDEMSELLKKEILSLNVYYSTNARTGRAELIVRGAGNDLAESQRALGWMKLLLTSPNWSPENLPRLRDVVDQQLAGLRNRMQGSEESWVNDPATAYWRQDSPLFLATSSFLTRTHNVMRLRWLLMDPGQGSDREAIAAFLASLADAGGKGTRVELKALLAVMKGNATDPLPSALVPLGSAFSGLPVAARTLAAEAARDLDQTLQDIPEETLPADWAYLCLEMRHDLLVPTEQTFADLNSLRASLLKTGNARLFQIGSRSIQQGLEGPVNDLVSALSTTPAVPVRLSTDRVIDGRLAARNPGKGKPLFLGFIQPNLQSGVFLNSAPLVTYADKDAGKQLDYLAANLFAGRGAHGVFIKTWGAGLAYSNGFRLSPANGRLGYYAERTPELPQTLRFVITELKKAGRDPSLAEYAVAQAFNEFRSAASYESRGEAMAADLADGQTPEVVTRFRKEILALRATPGIADKLFDRMGDVYARVLPGYTAGASVADDAINFVIGPEKQIVAYEEYLKTVMAPDTRIIRIYPRDFWQTAEIPGS